MGKLPFDPMTFMPLPLPDGIKSVAFELFRELLVARKCNGRVEIDSAIADSITLPRLKRFLKYNTSGIKLDKDQCLSFNQIAAIDWSELTGKQRSYLSQ